MDNRYLFRGKNKSGEWLIGSLIMTKDYVYIFPNNKNKEDMDSIQEVGILTVNQSTGMRDCNGTLVYECDILKQENKYFTVKWDSINNKWIIHNDEEETYLDNAYYAIIIGNAYDNPDLL